MGPSPCPHHERVIETLDDHETRLRGKRDRLLTVELEVEGMNKKMDLLVVSQQKTQDSVDSLKYWQTGIMGGFALLLFAANNWSLIAGLFR